MKRLCITLSLSTFCLFAPALANTDDWLDQIDQEFEQTFEKTDAAFDRAMTQGVEELDRELAEIWGQNRRLPEPKVWVGYSQDYKKRIVVDYVKGEMSVEGFEVAREELVSEFQDILLEDNDRLNERAALRRKLIKKTKRFWKRSAPRSPQPKKWKQNRELSRLIKPRARPRFVKRENVMIKGKKRTLTRMVVPLRTDRDQLSAQALQAPIFQVSSKYDLPRSLILSIIKNESSFNPRARSHANALGLMQLVPTSGGKEAYSYLQGQELTPSPEILYDPDENILLGATYLHLLNTRYFGKVKDAQTRQYLIIAAYNTGAGNVAKAFVGKMKIKAAIEKINALTAEQVYAHLIKHLPYKETRTYLARVSRDTTTFADWDKTA